MFQGGVYDHEREKCNLNLFVIFFLVIYLCAVEDVCENKTSGVDFSFFLAHRTRSN